MDHHSINASLMTTPLFFFYFALTPYQYHNRLTYDMTIVIKEEERAENSAHALVKGSMSKKILLEMAQRANDVISFTVTVSINYKKKKKERQKITKGCLLYWSPLDSFLISLQCSLLISRETSEEKRECLFVVGAASLVDPEISCFLFSSWDC